MKLRTQIISSLFLVIYTSFLLHNLFTHSHVHEHSTHNHCNFVVKNHEIDQVDFSTCIYLEHVDNNCNLCENDGKMHQHFVFIRIINQDQNALAPQQESLGFYAFHKTGEIFSPPGDPVISQTPLTPSLRAPPAIS